MTKSFLIGVAAAVASLGAASAADMPLKAPPPPVPYIWTGCYVGGNVGGGFGQKTFTDVPPGALIDGLGDGRSFDVSLAGVVGGGQVGCDYQFSSNWVIGVQGNFDATSLRGSGTDFFLPTFPLTINANVDSVFAAVVRLGYTPVTNWLFYLEGGAAWARDHYSLTATTTLPVVIPPTYSSFSETRTGAVVGAGVEWIFWQNWSAFVQWDHYFFGDSNVPFTCTGTSCGATTQIVKISQDIDTFRVGVNFRFGPWPWPH
jgi:outer membrane immunogenic protein